MSVNAQQTFHRYMPGSAQAPEALPGISFTDADDIAVYHEPASGIPTMLLRGVHYNITLPVNGADGSITAIGSWPIGDVFHAQRETTVEQPSEYDPFKIPPGRAVEADLDRLTRIAQEQARETELALRVPRGQLPPEVDFSDLIDGDLLAYRDGKLRRFLAAPFAGKYYVGAAGTGLPVPATAPVAGSDAALRADLAAVGGAALVAFKQAGAEARDENLQTALQREVWADQFKLVADAHDGPCITRAVAAVLAAGGGGVVRLSRRTYTLN